MTEAVAASAKLPEAQAWQAAAQRRPDLFGPLDAGSRVALLARAQPDTMLLWQVEENGVAVCLEPFAGYAASGADIALACDDEALAGVCAAGSDNLFDTLRAGIRSGHIVCYILRRRCHLEERGFEELLTELGFAFMGACR
ncbi:MAG TPA: hypothetical protein VFM98_21225 [Ramlibacter sp.]|uniref:hypothetical protein n=1 Tax=Ramlibacter sp. TaxID=1917967 RepID=UPI002D80B5A8|nr:hypothetical protein [Ramlibacter sp.]HET8748133.1 hypothetical protein [Ramlibacter sp.]